MLYDTPLVFSVSCPSSSPPGLPQVSRIQRAFDRRGPAHPIPSHDTECLDHCLPRCIASFGEPGCFHDPLRLVKMPPAVMREDQVPVGETVCNESQQRRSYDRPFRIDATRQLRYVIDHFLLM